MVTNIPGLDLGAGAEVMEYIPPFQVIFLYHRGDCCTFSCICTCDGVHSSLPGDFFSIKLYLYSVLQAAATDPPHPMLFLVYQQPGPIIVLETQQVTHHPDYGQSYARPKSPPVDLVTLGMHRGHWKQSDHVHQHVCGQVRPQPGGGQLPQLHRGRSSS